MEREREKKTDDGNSPKQLQLAVVLEEAYDTTTTTTLLPVRGAGRVTRSSQLRTVTHTIALRGGGGGPREESIKSLEEEEETETETETHS